MISSSVRPMEYGALCTVVCRNHNMVIQSVQVDLQEVGVEGSKKVDCEKPK